MANLPRVAFKLGQGRRTHPPAQVGDVFGPSTVIRLVTERHKGRSDERVVYRCVCGIERETYVATLRGRTTCGHKRSK